MLSELYKPNLIGVDRFLIHTQPNAFNYFKLLLDCAQLGLSADRVQVESSLIWTRNNQLAIRSNYSHDSLGMI